MAFEMRTSLHGRRLGLSSTGGVIQAINSSGKNSTDFIMAAQMWGEGMVASHSSSGATLKNVGTNIISSATAAAYAFSIATPVADAYAEILSDSSATTITIGTGATTIFFRSTGGGLSTGLTISVASTLGGCVGEFVILRGISATRWHVRGKSAGVST